jgi:hypothetical protein
MPNLAAVSWKDVITLGVALLGAGLGIMNTWNAVSQRRVRVRVAPSFLTEPDGSPLGFSIEIINLSAFPITLAEVGFDAGRGKRVPARAAHFPDNKPLPRRIEPRESVLAMFCPAEFGLPNIELGDAYVRTACGRTVYGNSPAGRQFSKMLAEITEGR